MQRLHEWKADMLTLRDLRIIWQRYERMPKQETGVRIKNNIMVFSEVSRGHSKPATSCLTFQRQKTEVSQKDEGLNVRMAKKLEGLW
jgi:hypothetical protein